MKKNYVYTFGIVLLSALSAKAQEPKYYFVICGYQDKINSIEKSHTFARFMEVMPGSITASDLEPPKTEKLDKPTGVNVVDISWLPANFRETFSLGRVAEPKPGANYSFNDTLEFARKSNTSVWCSSVTETDRASFNLAKKRKKTLENGARNNNVQYQAFVPLIHSEAAGPNAKGATNCIFAVADTVLETDTDNSHIPLMRPGIAHGAEASQIVFDYFKLHRFVAEHQETHPVIESWLKKKIEPIKLQDGIPHRSLTTGTHK